MAKWGEGDPRWIVEERPDSTNVNNWHWSEKNATNWSKELIKSLLLEIKHVETAEYVSPYLASDDNKNAFERQMMPNDFAIIIDEGGCGSWKFTEVSKLEGEASANNRKGKLIFFYEWELKAEWKGHLESTSDEIKGYLEVNNMSEENEPEDLDVLVSVTGSGKEKEAMKTIVRRTGTMYIKQLYSTYIRKLKEEFSQGLILPTKAEPVSQNAKRKVQAKDNDSPKLTHPAPAGKKTGVKVSKVQLELNEEFKTSTDQLYSVLTDETKISAFTRAAAEVYAHPGGKFSIFNGNVVGEYLELVPEKKIVQKWKFKDWPEGCYSIVTMILTQKSDCTMLSLTQTGIPDHDFQRTEEGWRRHFWENMKSTFGFGARLY